MHELAILTELVHDFCEARDWDRFHNPKDLAIGISTEASELLDHFRFKTDQDMAEILADPARRIAVGEELADVLYFLLLFARKYGFDLGEEVRRKLLQNEEKYPIKDSKGSNRKYNDKS